MRWRAVILCISVTAVIEVLSTLYVVFSHVVMRLQYQYVSDDIKPAAVFSHKGHVSSWTTEHNHTRYRANITQSTQATDKPPSTKVTTVRSRQDPKALQRKTPEEFLRDFDNFCQRKVIYIAAGTDVDLPKCSCIPDTLTGPIKVSLSKPFPTLRNIELQHPEVKTGGHWSPRDCIARHRVAIIVPYRDRREHLCIFLQNIHPLLQRQQIYYTIFVIQQETPDIFNKAMMMNIGFIEARKLDHFDCFIFHDVDMIPLDDRNIYACAVMPRHVGAYVDKYNFSLQYQQLFGGATAFTPEQFVKVNGFSNEFYGWGGEDDDMFQRVRSVRLRISRYPNSVAKYIMLKHKRDKGNPSNPQAGLGWRSRPKHYARDGLSSLSYKLEAVDAHALYTLIRAHVPAPPPAWTVKMPKS